MTTLFKTQNCMTAHILQRHDLPHVPLGGGAFTLTMTTGTSSLPSTSAVCSNLLPRYHEQNTYNNHFKISTTISLVNIFSIHTALHVKLMESITKQMAWCPSYILEPSNKQHAACLPLVLPMI